MLSVICVLHHMDGGILPLLELIHILLDVGMLPFLELIYELLSVEPMNACALNPPIFSPTFYALLIFFLFLFIYFLISRCYAWIIANTYNSTG